MHTDKYGNKYYVFTDLITQKQKRVVKYFGIADPGSLPPECYMWLHYITDDFSQVSEVNVPELSDDHIENKAKVYSPWQPKQ